MINENTYQVLYMPKTNCWNEEGTFSNCYAALECARKVLERPHVQKVRIIERREVFLGVKNGSEVCE